MKKFNVQTVARIGIMLACIIVVEIFESSFLAMPQGGGVSLSSIVFLLSLLMFQFSEATILFVLWRFLMIFIIPPFIATPMQFFLDYIVSYSMFLFIYPLIKKEKLWSILLAVLIANVWRYGIHVLTGIIYFADYAETSPVLEYSLIYNLTYMGPTLIVQFVLTLLSFPILKKWKNQNKRVEN